MVSTLRPPLRSPPPDGAGYRRIGLLLDRWEQAQEGMGQVVLLVGEAGLGKSRLVQTIKQRVLAEAGRNSDSSAPASPIIEWRCSQRFQNS